MGRAVPLDLSTEDSATGLEVGPETTTAERHGPGGVFRGDGTDSGGVQGTPEHAARRPTSATDPLVGWRFRPRM